MNRPEILELLNDALSAEYNSFIGHALASNPYVTAAWEADLKMLEELREEENDLSRALLVQFGRYRAGPTLKAFALWKEDLNFLSLEWLVIRAAEEAKKGLAAAQALQARLPDDIELRATFETIVATKKRHLARLEKAAAKMIQGRDARRAAQRAVTAIKVPGIAAPSASKPAASAAGGAPAPKPGGGKAPPLPGGFKAPAVAPKAPTPPGAAPKAPPLPPGAKAPAAPTPPSAPAAPAPEKKSAGKHPPLPPGFKLPGS